MTRAGAPVLMACLVSGCLEPTFVSLGHNDEAVRGEADASGGANTPPDDAGSFPFTAAPLACPEAADSLVLTSTCETRRPITCPDLDFPAQDALDAVLATLLRECGESVNQVRATSVQMAFEGCNEQANDDIRVNRLHASHPSRGLLHVLEGNRTDPVRWGEPRRDELINREPLWSLRRLAFGLKCN